MNRKFDGIDRRNPKRTVNPRHILLSIFAYGTLALATICLIIVAFWLFYPYKTIEQSPKPFPIVGNTRVMQGGFVAYKFNYTKHSELQATVHRQFVDGLVFASSSDASIGPGQSSGTVQAEIPIPYTLPPGRYKLRITATYQVNPLRTIEVVNETQHFIVVKAEQGEQH